MLLYTCVFGLWFVVVIRVLPYEKAKSGCHGKNDTHWLYLLLEVFVV